MPSLAQWDHYTAALQDQLQQADSGGGGGAITPGPGFTQAIQENAGWEREKLRSQLEDAQAGRANAYKIAQLSAHTSRYGTDQSTMLALKELKEKQRQFDLNHGLEYAKVATDYLSTPDRYFQGADFRAMADRALQGQGPTPYGSQGAPVPKTQADFGVLASYGQGGSGASSAWSPQRTGVAPVTSASSGGGGGGGGGAPVASTAGGGAAPDPRAKAMKAIVDAVPPSVTSGWDANDAAVLQAAQALYATNLQPGTIQKMRPGQQAILGSAGRRLGYDVNDWKADYDSYQPNQQSVRRAA